MAGEVEAAASLSWFRAQGRLLPQTASGLQVWGGACSWVGRAPPTWGSLAGPCDSAGQINWENSQKVRNMLARTHAHTQTHTCPHTCM